MVTGPGRILVIKLGALGDFVLATGAFKAIRGHHEDAHVTLLTTRPFAGLGEDSGWFDEVWIDRRPPAWDLLAWFELARRFRGGGFHRVYDLQNADRTATYFRFFKRPKPEWSGIASGCSHPHTNPARSLMHTLDRLAEQLAMAGISGAGDSLELVPDVSWARADRAVFSLPPCYALLCPGGTPHRPEKRWPASAFVELAESLAEQGATPVLLGAGAEKPILAEIARACRAALNLCGRTSLAHIAALARGAAMAVGNDTGPMHLIAAAGCPMVVLFSAASDPSLTAPRGPHVKVLGRRNLAALPPEEVIGAVRLRPPPGAVP